jgi:hypothetical protein
MELISSIFLILAVALLVALFVARPFLRPASANAAEYGMAERREHERSSLMAERDRVLTALQDLDFDYALGKVPEEDYPEMRGLLLHHGADVLRRLDAVDASETTGEEEARIEAAVAARRTLAMGRSAPPEPAAVPAAAASAANAGGANVGGANVGGARTSVQAGSPGGRSARADEIEDLIASRKRARSESAAGFCPKCGKPVQKSDRFCSKCGETL